MQKVTWTAQDESAQSRVLRDVTMKENREWADDPSGLEAVPKGLEMHQGVGDGIRDRSGDEP